MSDDVRDIGPTRPRIWGTWLVSEVDEHTCGTGPDGHYGHHEPDCGLIPEGDLSTLPGWDELVRTERAAALREAADKDAEVVNVHAGGGNLPVGRRVVTVDRLRDRADRIERGEA